MIVVLIVVPIVVGLDSPPACLIQSTSASSTAIETKIETRMGIDNDRDKDTLI